MMPTAPNPELLRTRIRLLAGLLGKVIERQAGAETLQTIEYLRQGFIEERNNPDPERRAALMPEARHPWLLPLLRACQPR